MDTTVSYEQIRIVIAGMERLYRATGLEYFRSQARSWSQWLWMLSEDKKREWGVPLDAGHPDGLDVCSA